MSKRKEKSFGVKGPKLLRISSKVIYSIALIPIKSSWVGNYPDLFLVTLINFLARKFAKLY